MTSRFDLPSTSADDTVADVYRADWGRLLSLLVARTRRLDLAEDALGEAFARASAKWPTDGVPDNPQGWLYTTAWRSIVGRLRAAAVAGRKAPLIAVGADWVERGRELDHEPDRELGHELDALGDERLALILLCCHPALSPESRSPLALRLVIGMPTDEIARLFLVSTPTMAARITRAKKKIVAAGIPLSSPVDEELRRRLIEVCRTIYLAFTAGYTPGAGPDLLRADLAGEAVELAAILHRFTPASPEVTALLALLLLQHSRRDARVANGELVTLAAQDRGRWRHEESAAGSTLLDRLGPTTGYAEELRLQALIAREHTRARTAVDTDWGAIAANYARLESLTGSPVVRLNRAVAVAEADDPRAGLSLLDGLDRSMPASHRLFAVRAELAHRAGLHDLARRSFDTAISLCTNEVEHAHLTGRRQALSA